jgi:hypothetical protein
MLPRVIWLLVRSYAASIAVCTRLGLPCMRRETQIIVTQVAIAVMSR